MLIVEREEVFEIRAIGASILFSLCPIPWIVVIIIFACEEIKYQREKSKIKNLESNHLVYSGIIKEIQVRSGSPIMYIVEVENNEIQFLVNFDTNKLCIGNNNYLYSSRRGKTYKKTGIGKFVKIIYNGKEYISDIELRMMEEDLFNNRIFLFGCLVCEILTIVACCVMI